MNRCLSALVVMAALAGTVSAQNLLTDPSFEAGMFSGWGAFGNTLVIPGDPTFVPRTGNFSVKMFGQFAGAPSVGGMFQSFPCSPGNEFEMDCWSRNNTNDQMTGVGAPSGNSVVMKIAFFDAGGVEIPGVSAEATVLDGNSMPLDTWIDNAPITATAPMGAVSVQALVLFLQPANDGGAAGIDDVEFSQTNVVTTYPGSGDDLLQASAVGLGASLSSGGINDVKTANAADLLAFNISSPMGTYDYQSYFLVGQLISTAGGPGSIPGFPETHIDIANPFFFMVDPAAAGPFGQTNPILPGLGFTTYVVVPVGLSGMSLMTQALINDASATNGFFAVTDAHEIQFN